MLTGSIFDALIAGNIVDNIVIIKDIKNTKNTSSYLISEGSVDKKYTSSEKSLVSKRFSRTI